MLIAVSIQVMPIDFDIPRCRCVFRGRRAVWAAAGGLRIPATINSLLHAAA
jgi:hypothetical protein